VELWCRCDPDVAGGAASALGGATLATVMTTEAMRNWSASSKSRVASGRSGLARLVIVDTMNEVAVDDVVSKIRDLDHDERRLQ
jgi:hypothetical protein